MGPSRSCWNGTTSALQLEEITSKGNSFMCVLSIKVAIQKKSGNFLNNPRMCVFYIITVKLMLPVDEKVNADKIIKKETCY